MSPPNPNLPSIRIKTHGSLARAKKRAEIKGHVAAQLKRTNLPKCDPSVIRFVAQNIENFWTEPKSGAFKLSLLHDILAEIYPNDYSEADKQGVEAVVQFLIESRAVCRKPIKFFIARGLRFLGRLFGIIAAS